MNIKCSAKSLGLVFLILILSSCSKRIDNHEFKIQEEIYKYNLFPRTKTLNLKKPDHGSTNEVLFLSHEDSNDKYVLISPKEDHSTLIKQNPYDVFYNTEFAGSIGIGPKVIALNLEKKFLIEEFLEGKTAKESTINKIDLIEMLIEKIFILHSSNPKKYSEGHSHIADITSFENTIKTKDPNLYKRILCHSHKIHQSLSTLSFASSFLQKKFSLSFSVPCHNDIHPDNVIILSNDFFEEVKLIDWDFSGIGDPFYDLSFAFNRFDFNQAEIDCAMDTYIKHYITKYKIKRTEQKDFSHSLKAYSQSMLPISNYWCALYTAIKMLTCPIESKRYQRLSERLDYYLKKVDSSYELVMPVLSTDQHISLKEVNNYVELIKNFVNNDFVDIYISGSGALKILDNAFYNLPIVLRDFDITLINKDKKEHNYLKFFRNKPLVEKIKLNHEKIRIQEEGSGPLIVGHQYVINGNGNKFDYDFTIFASLNLASTNGIFDTDKVMIKVNNKENFLDTLKKIKALGYRLSKKNGLIYDPYNGYDSWKQKKPQIIYWEEISRSPLKGAFRVARTYCKLDKNVDNNITHKIKNILTHYEDCKKSLPSFYKGLFRLLGDKNGLYYLKYLKDSGVFEWAARCYSNKIDFSLILNENISIVLNNFFLEGPTTREFLMLRNYFSFLKAIKNDQMAKLFHKEVIKNADKIFQCERDNIKKLITNSLLNHTLEKE